MTPNETQRANLRKLADFLSTKADPERFDIRNYRITDDGYENFLKPSEPEPECGTICCAAGYGPTAGIPAQKHETWETYVTRAFGALPDASDYNLWDWAFSAKWVDIDNTPAGAARRIRHYLEHGLPTNIQEQLYGDEPYLFAGDIINQVIENHGGLV